MLASNNPINTDKVLSWADTDNEKYHLFLHFRLVHEINAYDCGPARNIEMIIINSDARSRFRIRNKVARPTTNFSLKSLKKFQLQEL